MGRKRADFGKGYQNAGAYLGGVWSSAISTNSLSLLVADTGRLEFQADATEFDIDVPAVDGTFSFIVWAKPISGSVAVNADVMALGVGGSGAPRWWLTHSFTEAELYFNIVRNDGAGQKEYRIGSVTTDIDPVVEDAWFMASCTFDGASSMKVSLNGVTSATPDLQADGDISALTHPADVYGVVGNNRVFGFSGRQANHYLFMIAFWDVELSEAEITKLYNTGNGYLADPRADNGDYVNSANLKNMWLFGNAVSPNLGVNSVAGAQDFAAEVNVDDTNIIADAPGL